MNCPCDEIIFPPPLVIPAGLGSLPRQIAAFPEFRTALLSAIATESALKDWRARSSDDFGVMLFEMWAYVCDCIAFYDEVIANECYLRTAQLRPSQRKLVALLGYLPRPAVASKVELAVLAEGRQPITLPAGTAFRSGSFPGGSPQVFELDGPARVHPFTNQWTLAGNRPVTIDGGQNLDSVSLTSLLLDPATTTLKPGQPFLFEVIGGAQKAARIVENVSRFTASDGLAYQKVEWEGPISIPGSTLLTEIKLSTPTETATLWDAPKPQYPYARNLTATTHHFALDSLHPQLLQGDDLIIAMKSEVRWFKANVVYPDTLSLPAPSATTIKDKDGNVSTVTPPALSPEVTIVFLDVPLNDATRKVVSAPTWDSAVGGALIIHYAFVKAGTVTLPASPLLRPGDSMILTPPVEAPQDGKAPSRFLLEDKDAIGAALTASIDFTAGKLTSAEPLGAALVTPVTAYGNIVTATRGETVAGEVLGSGDGSIANQTFKLKQSPLTYLPSPSGVVSTLKVYVSGLEWAGVPSFFGVGPGAEVYIVRQNDDGESLVTFGDGVRGRRLVSGVDNVIAYYRFGAGKASPPAGSINQMARPVKGVTSLRNPVAAAGGDDAEPASGLSTYAPRSALLLGRAISIPDMEAAAASVGGVRAVRAEWRWNTLRQRPLVQVWYTGAPAVAKDVAQKLRGLSDSVTPIEVEQAMPIEAALSISIEVDPKRIEADVLAAVRSALMDSEIGLLAPERIGIGRPLFRSRIFEAILGVPGAVAVTGLLWNEEAFDPYGIEPGAGKYFDLENGTLLLNGKASVNG